MRKKIHLSHGSLEKMKQEKKTTHYIDCFFDVFFALVPSEMQMKTPTVRPAHTRPHIHAFMPSDKDIN